MKIENEEEQKSKDMSNNQNFDEKDEDTHNSENEQQ